MPWQSGRLLQFNSGMSEILLFFLCTFLKPGTVTSTATISAALVKSAQYCVLEDGALSSRRKLQCPCVHYHQAQTHTEQTHTMRTHLKHSTITLHCAHYAHNTETRHTDEAHTSCTLITLSNYIANTLDILERCTHE